jgi:hypothetical protein
MLKVMFGRLLMSRHGSVTLKAQGSWLHKPMDCSTVHTAAAAAAR